MTTKTHYDICDLVDLVLQLKDANIGIDTYEDGMIFDVAYFTRNANGIVEASDHIRINDSSVIRGTEENIDHAYRFIEKKIASGEWKKNDDCA